MTKRMYDAINVDDIPATGWDALAGYTTGRYPSYAPIKARFPEAPVLSIAIAVFRDAMCADIEAGDLTPAQAPAWLDRQYARGLTKPVLYGSDIDAIRAACGPNRPFWWWVPNGRLWNTTIQRPVMTPGADATQWQNHGPNGENVDQTIMSDEMFAHLLTGFTGPIPGTIPQPKAEEPFMKLARTVEAPERTYLLTEEGASWLTPEELRVFKDRLEIPYIDGEVVFQSQVDLYNTACRRPAAPPAS